MSIVIDKSMYKNFSCKLGKKNKITKVIGNQYIIDTSSKTDYEEGKKECAPLAISGSNDYRESHAHYTSVALFDWSADTYLREERIDRTITYYFTVTGKTITNINNIYATYTLFYNKYEKTQTLITSSNYQNSKYSNIFKQIKADENRPDSSRNEDGTYKDYDDSTNTAMPRGLSADYYSSDTSSLIGYLYPLNNVTHECKVQYVSKTKNADGVNYDYRFKVTFTFNYSNGTNCNYISDLTGSLKWQTCKYNEVVKILIEVHGYTVSKEEVNSFYTKDGDESKVLELQTNELLQQSVGSVSVGTGQKVISFNDVADEIITAYKDNRLIATFDLVNNRKYEIDGETRYLRAGDRIKIKDLEGKYLSSSSETSSESVGNDFEIIKANSKYDGFYYREIVAKEILNSNS